MMAVDDVIWQTPLWCYILMWSRVFLFDSISIFKRQTTFSIILDYCVRLWPCGLSLCLRKGLEGHYKNIKQVFFYLITNFRFFLALINQSINRSSYHPEQRWKTKGISVFSLHPGNLVSSDLSRHWWVYRWFFTLVRPFTKSLVSLVFNSSFSFFFLTIFFSRFSATSRKYKCILCNSKWTDWFNRYLL